MKKGTLIFGLFICFLAGSAQNNLDNVKKQMQGTWLSRGDSITEMLVTADSITIFRFRLNGVSRCKYSLSTQACDKVIKFPAATGIYILEKYATKTLCCSLAEIQPTSIKIIYPDGTEVEYVNESTLLKSQ